MGCYGIGVGSILAAVIEQHNDEHGIIFPKEVAPYQIYIAIANMKDEEQVRVANELYDTLTKKGIETILDDRDLRAGVKFKDADLIGIPYRVVVGRGASDNIVELKERSTGENVEIELDKLIAKMDKEYVK